MNKPDADAAAPAPRRRNDAARPPAQPDAACAPPPEAWRGILEARARALAQVPAPEAATERIEVVAFLLGQESYGFETAFVREVHPLKDLTPLPCTPPFVAGITNVRGQVLSVLDLRKYFGLAERGVGELDQVIILADGAMEFGILADAILGVRSLALDALQPALPTLTGIRVDCLRGVTADRLAVLDAARLLGDGNIVVQEEVA